MANVVESKSRACLTVRPDDAVVQTCGSLALVTDVSAPLALPAGFRRVAWDLSRVSDIDARGVGALADAARRASIRGIHVSVRAASAVVHRLASLAGLDSVIPGDWHVRVGEPAACRRPSPPVGRHRSRGIRRRPRWD